MVILGVNGPLPLKAA